MASDGNIPATLEIHALRFGYDSKPVLEDVSFSIRDGEFVALIGPNGSGKTTLLKILLGLLVPERGAVLLDREPIGSFAPVERAKKIAYVSQQPASSFPLTVLELVSLGRYPHARRFHNSAGDDRAVDDALALTDSLPFKNRSFSALSGGERQKVLIARALAQTRRILLLDEPTVHLDLYYQLQILRTLKKLCVERRSTVVAVLHDLNLVSLFADKALMLGAGKIQAYGSVGDVVNEKNIQEVFGVAMTARMDEPLGIRYFLPRDPLADKRSGR